MNISEWFKPKRYLEWNEFQEKAREFETKESNSREEGKRFLVSR